MVGCVSHPAIQDKVVAYYCGVISTSSPDGRIPFNKTEVTMMREIRDGGREIVETRTEPGISPSMPPHTTTLRLTRRAETLVYDASDEKGLPCGIIRFGNQQLNVWTYALNIQSAENCSGKGKLTEKGILVSKETTGARPMLVTEELHAVSRSEYDQTLSAFRPPHGAE